MFDILRKWVEKVKKYYYVGIMSASKKDDTIQFVYKINYDMKIAHWKKYSDFENGEKPLLFKSKRDAEEIAFWWFGVCAMVISTNYELK